MTFHEVIEAPGKVILHVCSFIYVQSYQTVTRDDDAGVSHALDHRRHRDRL